MTETKILEIAQPCMIEGEHAYMVLNTLYLECCESSAQMVWYGITRAFGLDAIKSIREETTWRFAFKF